MDQGVFWCICIVAVFPIIGLIRKLIYDSNLEKAARISENVIRNLCKQKGAISPEDCDNMASELIRNQAIIIAHENPEKYIFTLQSFCKLDHETFHSRELLYKTLFELAVEGAIHKIISHEDSLKLVEYIKSVGYTQPKKISDHTTNLDDSHVSETSYFEFKYQRIALIFGIIGICFIILSLFLKDRWHDIYDISYKHGLLFWTGCTIIFIALGFYTNIFKKIMDWIQSGK